MGYQSLQLHMSYLYWANLLAYFYKIRNESKIIFKLKSVGVCYAAAYSDIFGHLNCININRIEESRLKLPSWSNRWLWEHWVKSDLLLIMIPCWLQHRKLSTTADSDHLPTFEDQVETIFSLDRLIWTGEMPLSMNLHKTSNSSGCKIQIIYILKIQDVKMMLPNWGCITLMCLFSSPVLKAPTLAALKLLLKQDLSQTGWLLHTADGLFLMNISSAKSGPGFGGEWVHAAALQRLGSGIWDSSCSTWAV